MLSNIKPLVGKAPCYIRPDLRACRRVKGNRQLFDFMKVSNVLNIEIKVGGAWETLEERSRAVQHELSCRLVMGSPDAGAWLCGVNVRLDDSY